jgi:hypothetical protein
MLNIFSVCSGITGRFPLSASPFVTPKLASPEWSEVLMHQEKEPSCQDEVLSLPLRSDARSPTLEVPENMEKRESQDAELTEVGR